MLGQLDLVAGEVGEGDELVEHQLLTDEATRLDGFVPRHADDPGHRGEGIAQQQLQRDVFIAEQAADPADDDVAQRDQRDEGQQHAADIDRQLHARGRAGGGGIDDIGRAIDVLAQRFFDALGLGLGLRNQHLGHQQATRRRHEGGCQQVLEVDAQRGVAHQYGTGHRGQAAGHHGEQLRAGHASDERTHDQRSFGLADEDVGGRG